MKCDMKTMFKSGLGLAVLIAVVYAALPAAREWIAAVSPFLFFLICPLMMLFMMKAMQSCHVDNSVKEGKPSQVPTSEAANVGSSPLSLDHQRPL